VVDTIDSFIAAHPVFVGASVAVLLVLLAVAVLSARTITTYSEDEVANLDPDVKKRIWEHGLHEDDTYNNRLNFFLVFESVLLGVVGTLFTRTTTSFPILRIIALYGLAITLLWMYVQARHKAVLDAMKARARQIFQKEYGVAVKHRGRWPIPVMWLLTYMLPLLVAIAWLGLLAGLEGWYPFP
jgi:hypothetical protein